MKQKQFNDLFDIPEVDLQLFNNAWKKIKKELYSLKDGETK